MLCLLTASLLGCWAACGCRHRSAIHEEVEAATRVSAQWLKVVLADLEAGPPTSRARAPAGGGGLGGPVRPISSRSATGRRACATSAAAHLQGRREAPEWFAPWWRWICRCASLLGDFLAQPAPDAPARCSTPGTSCCWPGRLGPAAAAGAVYPRRGGAGRGAPPLEQVMGALSAPARPLRHPPAGLCDARAGAPVTAFNGMADRLQAR